MELIVKQCVDVIRSADAPLSINEIRAKLPKEVRFKEKDKNGIAAALQVLPPSEGIAAWPNFGVQRNLFSKRSLPQAVGEALPELLSKAPMTVGQSSAALKKQIKKTSEKRLQAEAREQLRILAAKSEIFQVGNYFCSPAYFSKPQAVETPFSSSVAEAVKEMETARGNYVSIADLRNSPTFRRAIDDAILKAAQDPGLVLAPYDGPSPLPGERPDLLDAGNGEFFVGVARTREQEAA